MLTRPSAIEVTTIVTGSGLVCGIPQDLVEVGEPDSPNIFNLTECTCMRVRICAPLKRTRCVPLSRSLFLPLCPAGSGKRTLHNEL